DTSSGVDPTVQQFVASGALEEAGIEVEFGADELGAAAARESVRVPEADAVATGVHQALDVAAMIPQLPPDEPLQAEGPAQQPTADSAQDAPVPTPLVAPTPSTAVQAAPEGA